MKKQTSNDTELTRAIERIDLGRGMDFGSLFDDFLDFLLSFQCANPTDRQQQLFGEAKANTELWNAYADAIKAYETAAGDYHDPLGDTFMSRISHGSNGQFFTPDAVCSLLARITIDGTGQTENFCENVIHRVFRTHSIPRRASMNVEEPDSYIAKEREEQCR